MSIEQLPTEELLKDLEETQDDLAVARKAKAMGLTTYNNGTDAVQYRIEVNEQIEQIIKEELNRRGVQYDGSNRTIQ